MAKRKQTRRRKKRRLPIKTNRSAAALVKRNMPLIQTLAAMKAPKVKKLLLKAGGRPLINSICSICKNVKLGVIKPTRLKAADRKVVDALASPKVSQRHKSKLIEQKGGFLPFVLPLVGKAIGAIASNLL